jgi:hypothetical protein
VSGCGRRHFGRGYCRTHHARWVRHGDPGADVPIERKTTGGTGYWSVHHRLSGERGPATAQRCACGAPAREWSYDGTDPDERTDPTRGYRYSLDPARYLPRCRRCHRRATLDRAAPRTRAARVVDVERAARLYRAGASAPGIAALLGTSRTAVYTALRAHGVEIRPRGTRGTFDDHPSSPSDTRAGTDNTSPAQSTSRRTPAISLTIRLATTSTNDQHQRREQRQEGSTSHSNDKDMHTHASRSIGARREP